MCEDMLRLTMLWLMLLLLCGQSIKGQRAAFPGGARSPCLLTLFLWAIKGSVYAPTAGEQPADLPSPLLSLNGCKLISSLLLIPASLSQDSYSLSLCHSLNPLSASSFLLPLCLLTASHCFLSLLFASQRVPPASHLSVAFVAAVGRPWGNAEDVATVG